MTDLVHDLVHDLAPPYLIHALCFQNKRTEEMRIKFRNVGVDPDVVHFYGGVPFTDSRLQAANGLSKWMYQGSNTSKFVPNAAKFVPNDGITRCWSLCYGHLDMIRHYYDRTADMASPPLGIFCEDDVLIRRDFVPQMDRIVHDFYALKLDILLLGYLCSFPIHPSVHFHRLDPSSAHPTSDPSIDPHTFQYFRYPSDTWGTQMFMMTREHAGRLLETYEHGYVEYTIAHPSNTLPPFSADWTLTKQLASDDITSLALLYPPMAIEDGKVRYEHEGQQSTRDRCFQLCYSEDVFGQVL